MKEALAVFALGLSPTFAFAADMPNVVNPPPPVVWSWTGLYLGGHVCAGFSSSPFSDSAGPAIFGGTVKGSAALGCGQVGYNWQLQSTALVLGAEVDADAISADGTGTCFASSGFFISAVSVRTPAAASPAPPGVRDRPGRTHAALFEGRGGLARRADRYHQQQSPCSHVHRSQWRAMAGRPARAWKGPWLRPGRFGWNMTTRSSATSAWRRPRASSRPLRRRFPDLFQPPAARPTSARACKPSNWA